MRLLFIDTETGGVNSHKDALFEVALIVWEDGKILDQKLWSIATEDKYWTARALEVNGINPELHNQTAISRATAARDIREFVKKYFPEGQAKLAGHNVSFDRDFLRVLIMEESDSNYFTLFSYRLTDTMAILNFLVAFGKLPDEVLSSDGAFKYFDIKIANRHSAMGDVEGTVALFNELSKFLR